jgi:hypothetical protein
MKILSQRRVERAFRRNDVETHFSRQNRQVSTALNLPLC